MKKNLDLRSRFMVMVIVMAMVLDPNFIATQIYFFFVSFFFFFSFLVIPRVNSRFGLCVKNDRADAGQDGRTCLARPNF